VRRYKFRHALAPVGTRVSGSSYRIAVFGKAVTCDIMPAIYHPSAITVQ
jgi:hypothetical protein